MYIGIEPSINRIIDTARGFDAVFVFKSKYWPNNRIIKLDAVRLLVGEIQNISLLD